MPILDSELTLYRSNVASNTSANGGRLGFTPLVSDTLHNLFGPVLASDNSLDLTRYRKPFLRVSNPSNLEPSIVRVGVFRNSSGADEVTIFPSTSLDTQADITGTEPASSGGKLNLSFDANAVSIQVQTEAGIARPCFHDGQEVAICNRTTPNGVGDLEYVKLASVNAVAWSGNIAILTLDPLHRPVKGYQSNDTYVFAIINLVDMEAKADSFAVVSSAGNVGHASFPVGVPSLGGVPDKWTLRMTTQTSFTCTGEKTGALPTPGSFAVDYSPSNPFTASPYFTINKNMFGGSFEVNDTITFITHPVSDSFWVKQFTPANTAADISDFELFLEVV